jgi:hypothetical protein
MTFPIGSTRTFLRLVTPVARPVCTCGPLCNPCPTCKPPPDPLPRALQAARREVERARLARQIALRAVQGGTARPRVYGYAKRRVENALRRLRKLEQEAAARGEKRY